MHHVNIKIEYSVTQNHWNRVFHKITVYQLLDQYFGKIIIGKIYVVSQHTTVAKQYNYNLSLMINFRK